MQHLRNRIEQTQARIDAREEEHGRKLENENEMQRLKALKKNLEADLKQEEKEIANLQKIQKQKEKELAKVGKLKLSLYAKIKERNAAEARFNLTKSLDELEKEKETLERKNEEDRQVIEDENTSPSEREAAAARVAERDEELAKLRPQN